MRHTMEGRPLHSRLFLIPVLLAGLFVFLASLSGCTGRQTMADPGAGGQPGSRYADTDSTENTPAPPSGPRYRKQSPFSSSTITDGRTLGDEGLDDLLAEENGASDTSVYVDETGRELPVWEAFSLAEEYYLMGVIANREASWEEAHYFFEKALRVLANLDMDSDSTMTPENIKYTTLLDNIVTDYRVTLRSLGRLDEDAAPSAIVERFGDVEDSLRADSMLVYRVEGGGPASYDLPVVMNDRVRSSIVYFQTVANEAYRRYLSRVKKYGWLFSRVLKEYGIPQDLIYLSLVESGYNPHAYSWARAMGLWQFIGSTGKLYGLNRNWWVDERKDPVKATYAAARFLKDLYNKFGDWELAMAAYNGGPGRVDRTIKQQRTEDFWKMKLRRQTMDYVPLIYAAAILAKNPDRYGFGDVQFEPELRWDEVIVDRSMDLRDIAAAIGCTTEKLKELNPELLRNFTPPNTRNYVFKVPVGMAAKFREVYDRIPTAKAVNYARHKVKKRETLASIANRYGVSTHAILDANNMSLQSQVRAGTELIIPVPAGSVAKGSARSTTPRVYSSSEGAYRVRSGDTMWDIAQAFGVSLQELMDANGLTRRSRLAIGQQLRIPGSGSAQEASVPKPTPKKSVAVNTSKSKSKDQMVVHSVRSGDTIWDIAQKYGTTPQVIRKLNNLGNSRIHVGQKLIVKDSQADGVVIYQVKRGDTLEKIADRFNTTVGKILASNPMDDPSVLRVGERLKIVVD